MTWLQFIDSIPADDRYEVEERAGIHEDSGLTREQAERRTMEDYDQSDEQQTLL